tara:strand:+ start:6121 stop:7140 length:1020 start_codon:yes stop_codon:yes gene_type:complete
MAKPNFFNENENRTFPFKNKTAGIDTPAAGIFTMLQLPDSAIVDCGFIMGPESGYVEGVHSVSLYKISKVSDVQINYEFRCDAPALVDSPLIFVREVTDDKYVTTFQESDIPEYLPISQSASVSLSTSEVDIVCGEPFWSGYLVTGSTTSLSSRMSLGSVVTRSSNDEVVVEEGLIQNLDQSQAVSINIANADRTRALTPANCLPNEWSFTTGEVFITQECLQGEIVFTAGYNLSLVQIDASNTIRFGAVLNAGAGTPCEELKLFASETPPIGATNNLLEGDFYCNETVRTINGLQGPNLVFFAGSGVAITADTATSTIEIDVNLVSLSVCTFSISESV